MKFSDLKIQTQREFPNNARTQGFGWLSRAGYITRENEILPLGARVIEKLKNIASEDHFFFNIGLPVLKKHTDSFFLSPVGSQEIIHCEKCGYVERQEFARAEKKPFSQEAPLPLEKVETPGTNTIESLANFLNIPKEKTAKALMYTREADGKFIFIVVRGDMQMSDAKLKNLIGNIRQATNEEISKAGAVAGYASPIGLRDAIIITDDLIPRSPNLVAGANEPGFHLINTNSGRDYTAEIVEDLTNVTAGNACFDCGAELSQQRAEILASRENFYFDRILLALAEIHHDEKGLALPKSTAPFDVHLMHVPGKTINTLEKAEGIYKSLQAEDISVLFDDREERAGVKFNDADLIGCPIRITVGERGLQSDAVEVKPRKDSEAKIIPIPELINLIKRGVS